MAEVVEGVEAEGEVVGAEVEEAAEVPIGSRFLKLSCCHSISIIVYQVEDSVVVVAVEDSEVEVGDRKSVV